MDKGKLLGFIDKYHLGLNIETVVWEVDGKSLKTSFQSDDKTVLGEVKLKEIEELPVSSAKIGVYTTSILLKLLGVVNKDVKINFLEIANKYAIMDVSDDIGEVNFMLCDTEVVPRVPELKQLPVFDLQLKIDQVFVDRFIKGKNALPDVESFTIITEDNKAKIVIGWSNINSNRTIIKPETIGNVPNFGKISFSAKYFKEILSVNKDCKETILEISSRGLAHIKFDTEDFLAKYYLVALDSQD